MPFGDVVVAVDCGTSSTKALAVNAEGAIVARAAAPLGLSTPQPGWVEQDPLEIIASAEAAAQGVIEQLPGAAIVAVGVSNQRESIMLWDRATGQPVSPLLSWQDRRTQSLARDFVVRGFGDEVRAISGLPLDAMFSAVKATWLLDKYDPSRDRASSGALCMGTVDSWIAWNLTGEHVTEPGNASRTSLLDISSADWSSELLKIFEIPAEVLPVVGPSARNDLPISAGPLRGAMLAGLLGDSHAALFAHQGWRPGTAKATLGTGSSVMATADVDSAALCRTIAWQTPDSVPMTALEGNILAAGAALTWLAGLFNTTPDELIRSAPDATSVSFVPAFDGLGAPWWDPAATGLLSGLSFSTTRGDLARAALDAVVMQIADVITSFTRAGVEPTTLVVDGGMTENASLMQDLADATGKPIRVSMVPEASAIGAAMIAGVGVGMWSLADFEARPLRYRDVVPRRDVNAMSQAWATALSRSRMRPRTRLDQASVQRNGELT